LFVFLHVLTQYYRLLCYCNFFNVVLADAFILLYCVGLAKSSAEVYCKYKLQMHP